MEHEPDHGPEHGVWRGVRFPGMGFSRRHALYAAFLLTSALTGACSTPAAAPAINPAVGPAAGSAASRKRGSKVLVIYYSRTGTTEKLAEAIAQATGADIEPLVDTVNRAGAWGFMGALVDAVRRRGTKLQPLDADPARYELVVIGTPDWAKSVSSAARTFLETYAGRLGRVAFFLTDGHGDHERIFSEMETLIGRQPVASLGVPRDDVVKDQFASQLHDFVEALPVPRPV